MNVVVVVVAASLLAAGSGCATVVNAPLAPRDPPGMVYAPDARRPPFARGQFATYEISGDVTGYERLMVLAQAACGTWIEDQLVTAHHTQTWELCVRDPGPTQVDAPLVRTVALARHQVNDERWQEVDGRARQIPVDAKWLRIREERRRHPKLVGVVGWIVPSAVPDEAAEAHATLAVPAGSFVDVAQWSTPSGPVWTHPAVPFGGVVSAVMNGRTYKLRSIGVEEDASRIASPFELSRRPVAFANFGYGIGAVTSSGDLETTEVDGPNLEAGVGSRTTAFVVSAASLEDGTARGNERSRSIRWLDFGVRFMTRIPATMFSTIAFGQLTTGFTDAKTRSFDLFGREVSSYVVDGIDIGATFGGAIYFGAVGFGLQAAGRIARFEHGWSEGRWRAAVSAGAFIELRFDSAAK